MMSLIMLHMISVVLSSTLNLSLIFAHADLLMRRRKVQFVVSDSIPSSMIFVLKCGGGRVLVGGFC